MNTIQANINLEPDEAVLLEMEPHNVGIGACGLMLLGVFMFLIPTVLAFIYWRVQKCRHRDSKCVATNRRIIVQNWGEPGRFLDLGYDKITGIQPQFRSGLGQTSSGSVVISLSDGNRIELDYVEGVAHFADVAQRAMEAHKAR